MFKKIILETIKKTAFRTISKHPLNILLIQNSKNEYPWT